MEIYLVGGAVRDKLLGLPVKERDWVVVGSTPEEMLALGYRQVGKDFPVFLHPETNDEYALARLERKVSKGYSGFTFYASPSVTLEQDLSRRDLTINAMAEKSDGTLIDPHYGRRDLENKILRHVSPAFIEDPVRILRVARFAARFADFIVAPETISLMQEMVRLGEVDALVPERVWKEVERALQEKNPAIFFEVLLACHALKILFPELNVSNFQMLEQASKVSNNVEVRFSALLHKLSLKEIEGIVKRYKIPNQFQQLAILVAKFYERYLAINKSTAEELLELLQSADAFRREARFKQFLEACEAIATGEGYEPNNTKCWQIYLAAKSVNVKKLLEAGFMGENLGIELNNKRIESIDKFINKS